MFLGKAQNFFTILAGAVLIQSIGSTRVTASTPVDLGPTISPIREKYRAPAVAAAATRNGELVALGAVGVRDLDSNQPVATTDRTFIGSCGKALTRLLIGRLVDRNLLQWDSSLADLLPDVSMRDEYRTVTLGDIIGHRGGIPAYTEIGPRRTPVLFRQEGSPRECRAAFIAHVLSETPPVPPKTQFFYSNAGYGILGHVAERKADKPFEQLMRDEVFRPLNLSTAIVGAPQESGAIAGWLGHEKTDKGFTTVKQARAGLPGIAPAGFMSCSIEDFARIGAALCNVESAKETGFLSVPTLARLPELRPGSKGTEGEIFFGGDGHYTAAFALWPSQGLAVVAQTNAGDSDDVCQALVNAVRGVVARGSGVEKSPPADDARSKPASPGQGKP